MAHSFAFKSVSRASGMAFVSRKENLEDKNMNLLKNKPLLRSLLLQGDTLNTVNGGTSMSAVNTYRTDNAYVITLSAPSVSPDSFNVYLEYNSLIIYSLLNTALENGEGIAVPMFSKRFTLPVDADLERIEALHEEGKLKVVVPFKADAEKFKRKIDIRTL
jgi:HSP20 family protein